MRADRLLSILMLLQARGRLSAQQLAEELEVSARTIYRDIDALCIAGVPIYAERGTGGGYALLDSYRTNLTGLTEDEVRALFMLSIPAPLDQLGVSQELKTALLKLAAALPASRRRDEEHVRQRIHLDSVWWFQTEEPVPHLPAIQRAVWGDRKLHLAYRLPFGARVERLVAPYGLVAKAGIWYLVYGLNGGVHVLRISNVSDAQPSDGPFERPTNFDLARFWEKHCADYEANRPLYLATVRVAPNLVPELPRLFGDHIREQIARTGPPDEAGWITLTLPFETFEAARERILGFGRAAEVLKPQALRESVLDFAQQIVTLYKT